METKKIIYQMDEIFCQRELLTLSQQTEKYLSIGQQAIDQNPELKNFAIGVAMILGIEGSLGMAVAIALLLRAEEFQKH